MATPALQLVRTARALPPHVMIGCGRDGLHVCKLTQSDLLGTLWPWMRQQLVRLKTKLGVVWLPEHVRFEMVKGLAGQSGTETFLAHDGDRETVRGFLVAYPLIDPFLHIPLSWFVWVSCIEPHIVEHTWPAFEQLARDRGFTRIQWATSRPGWERRATRLGAKLVEWTFVKEL